MILLCQTASHYVDDLYKDPSKFDIDRFLPDREEHMAPGAYAPYGLGTHTCLGHRWVDLQMTVNILMIAHRLKLEIVPADYRLRINPFPTCAPKPQTQIQSGRGEEFGRRLGGRCRVRQRQTARRGWIRFRCMVEIAGVTSINTKVVINIPTPSEAANGIMNCA